MSYPISSLLLMHSDDDLSEILGAHIVKRETIHQWPLSCVQLLLLDNGRKLIYKSQLPPTVEPDFYKNAKSDLLPGHRILGKLGNCDVMTIEWIDAPLLCEVEHSEADLIEHGRKIISQIGEISGNLPVYLDIGSIETWLYASNTMLTRLIELARNRRFRLIDHDIIKRLMLWAKSAETFESVFSNSRIIHGDLKADQVFVTENGYRIIDWQRTVIAPPDVDLASLLVEQHIEPLNFIDATVVKIFWFLRLYWAVEAQFDLFPDNRWPLFDQWASEAAKHILEIEA